MNTADYIQSEVQRQYSVKFAEFEKAIDYAKSIDEIRSGLELKIFLMGIASMVDLESNPYVANTGRNLRRSEVGFLRGGSASKAVDVESHFDRWCRILMYEVEDYDTTIFGYFTEGYITPEEFIDGSNQTLLDTYCKQLLQIHPWADGNGRTVSIFRNWCLKTLEDPTPLPYYFGEGV